MQGKIGEWLRGKGRNLPALPAVKDEATLVQVLDPRLRPFVSQIVHEVVAGGGGGTNMWSG